MKKRILICDDDADTREVVSLILRKFGYDVELVENGKFIIEKAKAFQPHLILLDVMMPEMHGKEARKQLRAAPETTEIPVIIFSALSNAEQIARDVDAEGYLPKPFDIKVLVEKISGMVE